MDWTLFDLSKITAENFWVYVIPSVTFTVMKLVDIWHTKRKEKKVDKSLETTKVINERLIKIEDHIDKSEYKAQLILELTKSADEIIEKGAILNEEFENLVHKFKTKGIILYTNILTVGFDYYNKSKLRSDFNSFYSLAKADIDLTRLEILDKEKQKSFTEKMDKIIREEEGDNFIDNYLSIAYSLKNSVRLEKYKEVCSDSLKDIMYKSIKVYSIFI